MVADNRVTHSIRTKHIEDIHSQIPNDFLLVKQAKAQGE